MHTTRALAVLFFMSISFLVLSCKDDSRKNKIADLEAKAFSLYEKDSYTKCRPYLDSLILLDSTNGEYFYKRAVCFDRRKKYRSAQNDFQRAIELHYRPGEAYFTMGLESMSGNDTAAISYFQKSLMSDPDKKEEVEPLIKTCRLELELENSDAAKEFGDIKAKRQKAKPVKIKSKKHQPKKT